MKLKNKITALLAVLGFLASCNDDITPTYTVGEAINAITLRAGISEGGAGVMTRAGAEDHHNTPGHKTFSSNTKLTIRVDGTWLGKADGSAPHGTISSTTVSQKTTATIGDGIKVGSDTENTHNEVTFTPAEQLYWDDYGTADPANMPSNTGNGRDKGLTIYGVAVDGETTAPTVSDWGALEWTLSVNQSTGSVWGKEDLLISNNIRQTPGDGTYKFDDYIHDLTESPKQASNLLEFTHAMSKITVNLIAGEGFPTSGVGVTSKRFTTTPDVILTSNLYGKTSQTEWAYTKGTVNVITGAVSSPNTPAAITTVTTKTNDSEFTIIKEALVMPGSTFADNTQVLSILVDGNRYYVSSEKIRTAIAAAIAAGTHANSYTTQPGKNYIFKVIINKTGIEVTATIKNWENVTADPVTPIINFSQCYGQEGTNFEKGFTLYRSKTVTGSYIGGLTEGNSSMVSYASAYTMSPQLYWPNHETHYFFRGVYPQVNTTDGPADTKVKANAVEVTNVAYTQNKYPSDLMIGMPRNSEGGLDETCKAGHNTAGICATDAAEGSVHANEGLIHMNFQYAMSQVEVELQSETGAAAVNINENTIVELVNVYNSGEVALSDGSVSVSGEKGNYTLAKVTGDDKKLFRHSAIVPQNLTYSTDEAQKANNLRFKITVTNTDGTTDVYYADVNPIKEKDKDTLVAPNGKWESGVHYKYILTLSKTDIKVTATIKDWVTVTASDNIWF